MLELRLVQGSLLKKSIDAMVDINDYAYFECSYTHFSLKALYNYIASVSLFLPSNCFDYFCCDRNIPKGISLNKLSAILKCADNDDIVTLTVDDDSDFITIMFENPSQDKVAEFELRLEDERDDFVITATEQLYDAFVRLPSAEFARICKDLSSIGDTVLISSSSNDRVRFSTISDIAKAHILRKRNTPVERPEESIEVKLSMPVLIPYSSTFLNYFAKAAPLASHVSICMFSKHPAVLEYIIAEKGYIKYYLAPEIKDEGSIFVAERISKFHKKPKLEAKLSRKPQDQVPKPDLETKIEDKMKSPVVIENEED